MASETKRVGLVFNADGSTDFIKSLKLVNSELKENYQDFRLVQEQWDKSTTSTQKLRDELVYLNNAYDIQKNKVAVLRAELEEEENAENRNENAIANKKAQLKQAEVQLQKYENRINESNKKIEDGTAKLEEYSKKLKESGQTLTDAGKKMSVFSAAYSAALGISAKSAIEFESAFAGVIKTVNGTPEQLEKIKNEIRQMSKELPATSTEISSVAEAAGQLGIETDNIIEFTKTMIDLGESTNLSADEAATTLARFANVSKMSQKDFDKLGSVIVALGNNFATTEADITNMGMNLASAGTQIGMSKSDIMALATALSSVGLEAQAGGTAFSKVMTKMQLAVETGSKDINNFAKVAGMSVSKFSDLFKKDATSAILAFVDGLSKSGEQGKSAIKILDDMGIKETRLRDALLRSANASEIFKNAIELGNEAWEDNTALTEEASKRYETTEAKLAMVKNTLNDLGISIGNILLPYIQKFLNKIKEIIEWFNNLNPTIQKVILVVGGIVAAIGPLLLIVGKLASSISSIMTLTTTIGPAIAGIISTIGPILAVIAAVVAAIVLITNAIKELWNTNEEFRNTVTGMINSIKESVMNIWESVLKPIFESLKETFIFLWEESLKPLWENFKVMLASVIELIAAAWNFIKPIFDVLIDILGPVFQAIFVKIQASISATITFISGIITTLFNFIKDKVNAIKKVLGGITDFVSGVFSGDWKKAWEGIKSILSGIWEGIAAGLKVPINAAIAVLNGMISAVNTVVRALNKIKLPDWEILGKNAGKGINIPTVSSIKYLAKGGNLLNGAAVVAEAGPELLLQQGSSTKVVPLSNNSSNTSASNIIDYNKISKAFLNALNSCKMKLDKDGFIKIVDDHLLEVL